MSFLDFEPCVLLDRTSRPDGYGGVIYEYADGARFEAVIGYENSIETKIAQSQGVQDVYTVLTRQNITLKKPDAFRRVSDGKTYQVTTDGEDHKTPKTSPLNMRAVSAKEWAVPNE